MYVNFSNLKLEFYSMDVLSYNMLMWMAIEHLKLLFFGEEGNIWLTDLIKNTAIVPKGK